MLRRGSIPASSCRCSRCWVRSGWLSRPTRPPSPVTTTADEFGTPTGCSLREAIQAANNDAAFGGCIAGNGDDTITLQALTYILTIGPGWK